MSLPRVLFVGRTRYSLPLRPASPSSSAPAHTGGTALGNRRDEFAVRLWELVEATLN